MQSFVYGNRAKVYQVVSSVTNVSYTERGGEGERERERTRTRKLEYWRMVALGPFGPVQQPVLAILQAQISTTILQTDTTSTNKHDYTTNRYYKHE